MATNEQTKRLLFHQNNLGGGMNVKTSPFLKKPNELDLGRNVSFDTIGAVSKRYGYGDATVLQASKRVLGAHEFVITTGNLKYLLGITNNSGDTFSVLKYRSTPNGTFTTHPDADCSALQKNALFEFANFIDHCFVVGHSLTNSAFQQIFSLNGIIDGDYDAVSLVSGAPNAKYILQSHDRLFLVNTSNSSNEYFWSDLPEGSPGSWTLTWTATNFNRIETNDGESLTGVGKNFNRVLFFKPSSIWKHNPDDESTIKETGNIGCTSHRSIKNLGGATIFFKEGYGFYEYRGEEPTLISRKIDAIIAAIPAGQDVCAWVDESNYSASIGNIVLDGRTYNNAWLKYDSILDSWSLNDGVNAAVVASFGETEKKTFYFGGRTDGTVYEMFSHSTTSTSSTSSSTSSTSSSTSSTSSTSHSTSSTSISTTTT